MPFNPQPKPIKAEKKKASGQWIGGVFVQSFKAGFKKTKKTPQRYRTSSGELLSDSQISKRLSQSYKASKPVGGLCECCGKERSVDHDHTISQRRCKILKIVELIWDKVNWSLSCRKCHMEWESYKSGLFKKHINYDQRMAILKEYDPEGYAKRKSI